MENTYLMGKNTAKTQEWFENYYEESASSKENICRWFAEFKCGCQDTNDAERSGHPNEADTPRNIKKNQQKRWDSWHRKDINRPLHHIFH